MTDTTTYQLACRRADEARARFSRTAQEAKASVSPARLKHNIAGKTKNALQDSVAVVGDTVRQRPVAASAAATAFVLFLVRRPLAALFGRLYVRWTNPNHQYSESDDG